MKDNTQEKNLTYAQFRECALRGKNDIWIVRNLTRKISTRISWLILKAYPEVTPNKISSINFVIGLLGCLFFILGTNSFYALAGAILLCFWMFFDHSDGEIARFTNQKSVTGLFLEMTFDIFVISSLFVSISFFIFRTTSDWFLLIAGLLSSIFFLMTRLATANQFWALFKSGKKTAIIRPLTNNEITKRYFFMNSIIITVLRLIENLEHHLSHSANIIWYLFVAALIDLVIHPSITIFGVNFTPFSVILVGYLVFLPFSLYKIAKIFFSLNMLLK
jgi:phosphatidylglycerophosphate synthase